MTFLLICVILGIIDPAELLLLVYLTAVLVILGTVTYLLWLLWWPLALLFVLALIAMLVRFFGMY